MEEFYVLSFEDHWFQDDKKCWRMGFPNCIEVKNGKYKSIEAIQLFDAVRINGQSIIIHPADEKVKKWARKKLEEIRNKESWESQLFSKNLN